jgi:hypothetical protein
LTDDKGRFVFEKVAAGDYAVRGSRPGYFEGVAGGDLPRAGDPGLVHVSDGQWVSTVTVKLWPPSTITGTVVDEHGEPVVGVYVRTLAQGHIVGRDVLGAGPAATTDDRGVYRISDLPPGSYIVMVPSVHAAIVDGAKVVPETPAPARGGHYPVTPPDLEAARRCYPAQLSGGTIDAAAATAYTVTSGMTQTVDLMLTPSPCVTVSGRVQGAGAGGLYMRLLPRGLEDTGAGSEAATTFSRADGSFAFLDVPQGAYVLDMPSALNSYVLGGGPGGMFYGVTIRPPAGAGFGSFISGQPAPTQVGVAHTMAMGGGRATWARMPIMVRAEDLRDVQVPLHQAATVTVRYVIENDPAHAAPPPIAFSLTSASASAWEGEVTAYLDRQRAGPDAVQFSGVLPGRYLFGVSSADWQIKSVLAGDHDYANTPMPVGEEPIDNVVITVTSQAATLGGSVTRATGAPSALTVVLFPSESAQWTDFGLSPRRIKLAGVATNDTYALRRIPAGDYDVVALPAAHRDDWTSAGFFARAAAHAAHVHLDWGQSVTAAAPYWDAR